MSRFEAKFYRNINNEYWFTAIIEAFDDGYQVYEKLNNIAELLNANYGQVKWLEKVK